MIAGVLFFPVRARYNMKLNVNVMGLEISAILVPY